MGLGFTEIASIIKKKLKVTKKIKDGKRGTRHAGW